MDFCVDYADATGLERTRKDQNRTRKKQTEAERDQKEAFITLSPSRGSTTAVTRCDFL
jgi:hypothetical protein